MNATTPTHPRHRGLIRSHARPCPLDVHGVPCGLGEGHTSPCRISRNEIVHAVVAKLAEFRAAGNPVISFACLLDIGDNVELGDAIDALSASR